MQTDKGVVLATALVKELRREKVVVPPITVIERVGVFAIGHYALRFDTPHLHR